MTVATSVLTREIPAEPVERSARRRQRSRSRRELVVSLLVCAGVPVVVLASLWHSLTVPLWYNEQWRAFYIADNRGWWAALTRDGAPFPAGWYFGEKLVGSLFGSTELTLRLPTAIFLPIACVLLLLLARRWVTPVGAVIIALVGSLTGALLTYSVQLSEYQIDAAAAVAVILLHELSADTKPSWRSARLWLLYAGIAAACLFSTPALFLAAPLLALDAVTSLRRASLPRLVAAVGSGLVVLAHLGLFVVRQNALTQSNFWDGQFVPHHGISRQVSFVWDGLRGFITGPFSPQASYPGEVIGGIWTGLISVALLAFLCIGVIVFARSAQGRPTLLAVGGALFLTLLASAFRYWPFGFVRTNYYLVPILVLIAGVGVARCVERAPRGAIKASAFVALGGIVALAAAAEVGTYRQTHWAGTNIAYGELIGKAVDSVKVHAQPQSAVIVAGATGVPGWEYYQYEYSGASTKVGHQVPASHVGFEYQHGSPNITRVVDRARAKQIFFYFPWGTSQPHAAEDEIAGLKDRGTCHQSAQLNVAWSGELVTFSCSR